MKRFSLLACLVLLLLLVPAVQAASPTISGISPQTGPNNGVVTITITGSNLDTVNLVRLNKCKLVAGGSSEAPFAGIITGQSSTKIVAKFDLTGKKVGMYSVSARGYQENLEVWGHMESVFNVYSASGPTPATTTTTTTGTTETETTVTSGEGERQRLL